MVACPSLVGVWGGPVPAQVPPAIASSRWLSLPGVASFQLQVRFIYNGSSAVLAGNTVSTSGRYGVNVTPSTARMVGRNVVTSNTAHGVIVLD